MSIPPAITYRYLERRPQSAYRSLFIKGTRIRARSVYGDYARAEDPWTPEVIAEQYNIPLEAVKEAIAYCQSNPPELLEDYRHEEALMEASGMNDPEYKKTGKTRPLSPEDFARIYRS